MNVDYVSAQLSHPPGEPWRYRRREQRSPTSRSSDLVAPLLVDSVRACVGHKNVQVNSRLQLGAKIFQYSFNAAPVRIEEFSNLKDLQRIFTTESRTLIGVAARTFS